ncbi:MAG: ATP-dependent DNA helicase RecG [Geodermatophilaceae bacterium]|nr:ATP-dependent DNA helicase RecG [Geodermatophilaceae bacterium]
MTPEVTRDSPLRGLLGGKAATVLAEQLGISTVDDLLGHYPRRYAERGQLTDLDSLRIGDEVTIVAQVRSVSQRRMRNKRGTITDVVVGDGKRTLSLVFFNQPWRAKQLAVGVSGLFAGKIGVRGREIQLTHPECEIFGAPSPGLDLDDDPGALVQDVERAMTYASQLIPVYPASRGMPSWTIARCLRLVLDPIDGVADPIPAAMRDRRGLIGLTQAWRKIHQPESLADVELARKRLKWDEALTVQVTLAQRRVAQAVNPAYPRAIREGGLLDAFDARLPFVLTAGQRVVGAEISYELAGHKPMNRLLQGEVGSGKTVVALRAMLQVIDAGAQTAFLAPTEVLAVQHLRTLRSLLGPLGIAGEFGAEEHATRVTLLTGSLSAKGRRAALAEAAGGGAGIVVGTHALLEEVVQFADLGLVVIDEQHRFGVEQRDVLRAKSAAPPHVLVLTATPIPRTVAMTVYGDLETTTLSELPAGRAEVSTSVVPIREKPAWMDRAWARIVEEARTGGRAFIVCPRIGDDGGTGGVAGGDGLLTVDDGDESLQPAPDDETSPDDGSRIDDEDETSARRPPLAVMDVAESLRQGPLAGLRLGVLHGRLPADEKDATMQAFAHGDLDAMVTTTVVEVGVDVPEASVMAIMDADRFGVSQLHQLRGRIGRGSRPGLCLLVTEAVAESPARARLEAVAATRDGFELARVDLAARREGNILGAAQSGRRSGLRLLSLLSDETIITEAREEATYLVAGDPDLVDHPAMAAQVARLSEDERADYLDKA